MNVTRDLNADEAGTPVAGGTSSPGRLSPSPIAGRPRTISFGSDTSGDKTAPLKDAPKGKEIKRAPSPPGRSESAGSRPDEADSDADESDEGAITKAGSSKAEAPDSDAESSASSDSPKPSLPANPSLLSRIIQGVPTVFLDTAAGG